MNPAMERRLERAARWIHRRGLHADPLSTLVPREAFSYDEIHAQFEASKWLITLHEVIGYGVGWEQVTTLDLADSWVSAWADYLDLDGSEASEFQSAAELAHRHRQGIWQPRALRLLHGDPWATPGPSAVKLRVVK